MLSNLHFWRAKDVISQKMNVKFHKITSFTWNFLEIYLCFHNSCEIWHSFSRTPMRNFLWCYYRLLITSVALECNIYKVLVHWELKLLNFLVDSVLISFLLKLVLPCYENKSKTRTPYVNLILIPQKNSTFRTEPNPNKSTAWTAVSNPIYNEVRVVPANSNPIP